MRLLRRFRLVLAVVTIALMGVVASGYVLGRDLQEDPSNPDSAQTSDLPALGDKFAGAFASLQAVFAADPEEAAAQAIAAHEERGALLVQARKVNARADLKTGSQDAGSEDTVKAALFQEMSLASRTLEAELALPEESCIYVFAEDTIECYAVPSERAAPRVSKGLAGLSAPGRCGAGKFCKVKP